jgi:hypothetical protein
MNYPQTVSLADLPIYLQHNKPYSPPKHTSTKCPSACPGCNGECFYDDSYKELEKFLYPTKKEQPMNTNIYATLEAPQTRDHTKEYLKDRLSSARSSRERKAMIKFGLEDDFFPRLAEDVVDRIKSGLYVINEERDGDCFNPWDAIEWRDPAIKKDFPGFKKWQELEKQTFLVAKDTVVVKSYDEGLKALQDYEALAI